MKHVSGLEKITDPLSRLTQTTSTDFRNVAEEYIRFVAQEASPKAISIQEVEQESSADPELSKLRHCIKNGYRSCCPPEDKGVRYQLAVMGKLISRGQCTRIVMERKLCTLVLDLIHEGHQEVVKTKQRFADEGLVAEYR